MENLTYERYLANPAVQAQVEREARQARAEAVHRFVVAPLSGLARRALSRPARFLVRDPELCSAWTRKARPTWI